MKKKFTLEDVEKVLTLKTWWASLFVLPIANRLILYIVNETNISPNTITLFSLFLRLTAGLFFLCSTYGFAILASICFYGSYLLDCIDGPVARLTGKSSEMGRYFDHLSDLVGSLFVLICLLFAHELLFSFIGLFFVLAHITECYISYLSSNILKANATDNKVEINNFFIKKLLEYRDFFFKRNFKSFFSFPDYEAVMFIFLPLFDGVEKWILGAGVFLFVIVNYTIFSTFLSVNFKIKYFP